MWHLREGLSVGVDGDGLGTWATQELVIAKRELHARILDSRLRGSLAGFAAIAPLYGKVALPATRWCTSRPSSMRGSALPGPRPTRRAA